MSLSQDLKSLKKQRREEIAKLHFVYLHTKRDFRRKASPDRFIRKHLGATMGVAAVLGLLIAPKPPKPQAVEKAAKKDTVGGHFSQLIRNVLMQFERLIPMPKEHAAHHRPGMAGEAFKPKGMLKLLAPLLSLLLTKIDVTKIVAEMTRSMGKKTGSNGHKPEVSVADAGSVKADNFHDFE